MPTHTKKQVPTPTWLSMRLDDDVAEVLHRMAYETGLRKRVLVMNALRKVYGEQGK